MTNTLQKEQQGRLQKLKQGWQKMQARRLNNQQQTPRLNAALAWFFPLFIVCLAELNQSVHIGTFLHFCVTRPSVLLFDFMISYLLFGLLVLLSNRIWLAALVQDICYMFVSIVELFKYSTNGNHLKLTELKLAPNVKNLTSFAYIKITVPLVIYVLIALFMAGLIFWRNPAFSKPLRKRILPAICCMAACFSIVCVPGISQTVYGVFDVDTTASENAFLNNEKFEKNSMLAFLVQTASENIGKQIEEPETYSEEAVNAVLTAEADPGSAEVQPNVIVIMSESFADFRRVESLQLQTDAYDAFDEVAAKSHALNVAVPTFASYTVRTEFELMYGLPVRALNDSITPQRRIQVEYPSSMISYFNGLGYDTAYVHPFTETFYGRNEIYARYGFDQMMFIDDFTVPEDIYGNGYVSDETITDQLVKLVKETDAPLYVHTTTMQNHQPYTWIEGETELNVYLEGVRCTGKALNRLTEELAALDEPTVLLFVGDHFPSMRAEGNIYDEAGINSENCAVLYEQPALIWSNFDLDESAFPQETVSTFYLLPTILRLADLPVDSFYGTVLEQMKEYPVYTSIFLENEDRNETLDLLTYDRTRGENYSGTRNIEEEIEDTDESE